MHQVLEREADLGLEGHMAPTSTRHGLFDAACALGDVSALREEPVACGGHALRKRGTFPATPLQTFRPAPTMAARHGNKQKHESRNPIQLALLGRFKREAIRLIRSVNPSTILEIGCGEGYMLDAVAAAGLDVELHGVDISAPAIDDARARLGDRAKLEVRDARELADGDNTYDLVMMLEVLEHIEDPGQMLPILARLTKGPVLLSVPWEPFFRGLNLLRGKNLARWGNDPEHVNHWSRTTFQTLLRPHFQILETPQVFPWTMVLARVPTRVP